MGACSDGKSVPGQVFSTIFYQFLLLITFDGHFSNNLLRSIRMINRRKFGFGFYSLHTVTEWNVHDVFFFSSIKVLRKIDICDIDNRRLLFTQPIHVYVFDEMLHFDVILTFGKSVAKPEMYHGRRTIGTILCLT